MFVNKKSNLPPKPHHPIPEKMLEDLLNAPKDDIAFKICNKEDASNKNLHFPMNMNDPEVTYKEIKTYLDVNQRLKELNESLRENSKSLQSSDEEMKRLVQDIRKQAQEALIK